MLEILGCQLFHPLLLQLRQLLLIRPVLLVICLACRIRRHSRPVHPHQRRHSNMTWLMPLTWTQLHGFIHVPCLVS